MMDGSSKPPIYSRISALLSKTAEAHDRYERAELGGVRDEEWPVWYAAYLLENGLLDLFPDAVAQTRLKNELPMLLTEADKSHRAHAPDENWPDYYAQYLVDNL